MKIRIFSSIPNEELNILLLRGSTSKHCLASTSNGSNGKRSALRASPSNFEWLRFRWSCTHFQSGWQQRSPPAYRPGRGSDGGPSRSLPWHRHLFLEQPLGHPSTPAGSVQPGTCPQGGYKSLAGWALAQRMWGGLQEVPRAMCIAALPRSTPRCTNSIPGSAGLGCVMTVNGAIPGKSEEIHLLHLFVEHQILDQIIVSIL